MNELDFDEQHDAIVSLHVNSPHNSCHLSSSNSMISRSEVADRGPAGSLEQPGAALGWR